MLDILGGGIFGSLIGGVFRLVPEVLKHADKKNERSHELQMFARQCELEAQRGAQKMQEIGAQRELAVDTGVVDALKAAIDQQARMAESAKGWVAAMSASVRPIVTYWILGLWSVVHLWFAIGSYSSGVPIMDAFKEMMTPDFAALVSGTLNYWFLDRTLSKRGLA